MNNMGIDATLVGNDKIVLEEAGEAVSKRVSFSEEEMTDNLNIVSDIESSSVNSEENHPSISSLSECSVESADVIVQSGRSIGNGSHEDVKNVLRKKYSKLAMSVHSVREGQPLRQGTIRRLRR